MGQREQSVMAVLDVGSHKTCVLAGEVHEGALRYLGHGVVETKGVRKGLIAELQPTIECLSHAAALAEQIGQCMIATAVAGIGGAHVRGVNSRGGVSLGNRQREITREDVRAAVDRARQVPLPSDREMLHLLPQEFILDDQAGIHDPVGMIGSRLEVNLHLSTCSSSAAQSIISCANKAGIEVTDTVYEAVAAAEAVLSGDERELGICIADIGAGSTEIAVVFEGSVAHTAVLPIGGDHFTNDLAVGLHIGVQEAERLKREYGHCVVTSVPNASEIEVMNSSGEVRLVRQRLLAEMLEPRATELFRMMRDNLRSGGVMEALGAGVVITGGGAHLAGILETAESQLRVPARIGSPVPLSRMPQTLARPEYATAIGMLLYAHRTRTMRAQEDQGLRAKLRAIFAGSL